METGIILIMKKNFIKLFLVLLFLLNYHASFAEDLIIEDIVQDPIKVNLFIRQSDEIVFSGEVNLPQDGTLEINDGDGLPHIVNSRSVLGILHTLDQSNDSFNISKLQYYESFSSFYIKCVTTVVKAESCDNWQYVINGSSPFSSVDKTILSGNENIGLYFGSPYKLELDKTKIKKGEAVLVKALSYDYLNDTWGKRLSVNIGITKPNDQDQWNPIVVSTTMVDDKGEALLNFAEVGSYSVSVSEDFYFPSYEVVVEDVSSSGGGGGGGPVLPTFSIQNALGFLYSNMESNGSYGNVMYTDWVAMAFSSSNIVSISEKAKIAEYVKNNNLSSNILTDNERHAMALMALGINPYNGTSINYIKKIIDSINNNQLGDTSLVNDDIFGLIVLKNAGYTTDDEIIKNIIRFVISKQEGDGSWGSVDMTAAAIVSLRNFYDFENSSLSIKLAEDYLLNHQNQDGGWGNSYSTSWAIQAMSLNPNLTNSVSNGSLYLARLQKPDGGMEETTESKENRIWSTSYAIPAVLGKSWNSIMSSFNKETITTNKDNNINLINNLKTEEIKLEKNNNILLQSEIKKENKDIVKNKIKKTYLSYKTKKTKEVLNSTNVTNLLSANAISSQTNINKKPFTQKLFRVIFSQFLWLLE